VPSTSNRFLLLLGAALVLACNEQAPDDVLGPGPDVVTAARDATPQLVACPSTESRSVSKTIGILGGSLEIDGTRVVVPVGAVLLPTTITLTLPASPYMEVDFTANSLQHFKFPVAVHVTIDYSRCDRRALAARPVTAWYIDTPTKNLLELMRAKDDRAARRVSFPTIHFSGYSIAQ